MSQVHGEAGVQETLQEQQEEEEEEEEEGLRQHSQKAWGPVVASWEPLAEWSGHRVEGAATSVGV
jgi:hypothetical protein